MDNRISFSLRNTLINVVNHRKTNLIVTSFLVFLTIYITLISIFNRNLIYPLNVEVNISRVVLEYPLGNNIENVSSPFKTTSQTTDPNQEIIITIFSLFILLIAALIGGKIVSYLQLPPLLGVFLGMLLVGIFLSKLTFLYNNMLIPEVWNKFLSQTAFILILMRCGIGIDPDALRNSLFMIINFGILSTTFEVFIIVIAAHFLFYIPLYISILFAYVLASTSPAVTVPTMIHLQNQGRGVDKGIPTVVLASASIDNIYCITIFNIILEIVFSNNYDLSYLLTKIPVEFLIASLFGILAGLLLRSFPRNDAHLAHFTRGVLLLTTSTAFYFGTRAINCPIGGPVAVILCCIVASMRWKIDNHKMTVSEEHGFKILWDLFFLPFLFVLIGLMLDFSLLTWKLFGEAIVLLGLGLIARIFIVFILSFFVQLNVKERGFLAFCFTPKATVQAALAPILVSYSSDQFSEYSSLILQTCILSIIITAPIGQLLMQILSRYTLHKKLLAVATIIDPYNIGVGSVPVPTFMEGGQIFPDKALDETKYYKSDKNNKLVLNISNNSAKMNSDGSNVATIQPLNTVKQIQPKQVSSFEEINQKAYELFKEQKLAKERETPKSNNISPQTKF